MISKFIQYAIDKAIEENDITAELHFHKGDENKTSTISFDCKIHTDYSDGIITLFVMLPDIKHIQADIADFVSIDIMGV